MPSKKPLLFARVEPELFDRVRAEADLRYEGNQSLLLRNAMRTYLRLREKLGSGFEPTMEALTGALDEKAVA
jgi:hypothetical protein